MKTNWRWATLMLATLLLTGAGNTFAQRMNRVDRGNQGFGNMRYGDRPQRAVEMLDLSEEQRIQLQGMRAEHQRDMRHQASLIREKEAHLQTLLTAPEQDTKVIHKTIDEIAEARASQMKQRLANRDDLKQILTEEQMASLDEFRGMRPGPNRYARMDNRHPRMSKGFRGAGGRGPCTW